MYPYWRALKVFVPPKTPLEFELNQTVVINQRVWLSDIDVYPELNNGRHLTMMDLGRYEYGRRVGLFKLLRKHNWGLMVAGNFTRYRRRLKFMQRYQIHTKVVAYDERWIYFYQTTQRKDTIHSSALIRTAVTSKDGLVSTKTVFDEMSMDFDPTVPDWVQKWIELNAIAPAL